MDSTPPLRIGVLALQGAFVEHVAALRRVDSRGKDSAASSQQQQPRLQVVEVRTAADLEGRVQQDVASTGSAAPPSLLDGLIIPGGESTSMRRLLESDPEGLLAALRRFVHQWRRPVFGTCAGAILLADEMQQAETAATQPLSPQRLQSPLNSAPSCTLAAPPLLGGIPMRICRNWYGRQQASFSCQQLQLHSPELVGAASSNGARDSQPAVFIRAPAITRMEAGVEVLASLPHPESHRRAADVDNSSGSSLSPSASLSASASLPAVASSDAVAVRYGSLVATCFHPELTDDQRWHRYFIQIVAQNKQQRAST